MPFWNKQEKPGTALERSPPEEKHSPEQDRETAAEGTLVKHAESIREEEEWNSMASSKREDTTDDLLLGHGAEFEGKLNFAGTVRIDATFTGSIATDDVLVVGEHAQISADITCGTVVVYGQVIGNIRAKTAVELHRKARVRGGIESPSLMIEKGAIFHGESKMPEPEKSPSVKPLSAAEPAPAMH